MCICTFLCLLVQGEAGPTGVRGSPGQQGPRGDGGHVGPPGHIGQQVCHNQFNNKFLTVGKQAHY